MTVNPAVFRKALYCVSGCIQGTALSHGLKILYSVCFLSPMSTSEQMTVTKEVSEITGISQLKVISTLGNQFPSSYYCVGRAGRLVGEQGQTAHAYTVLASLLAGSVQGKFIQVLPMSGIQSRSYGNSSRKTLKTG